MYYLGTTGARNLVDRPIRISNHFIALIDNIVKMLVISIYWQPQKKNITLNYYRMRKVTSKHVENTENGY